MRVVIDRQRVTLDPNRLLGEGGEASVFAATVSGRPAAVKLFRAPSAAKQRKLERWLSPALSVPPEVARPRALAMHDKTGEVVGFAMPMASAGSVPIAQLARASFRDAERIDLAAVSRALLTLAEIVERLHSAGIVVGDLNDQNELYQPRTGALAFIDADSFQLGDAPCEVSTEAYLDPRLNGPDPSRPCVTRDGGPRRFDPASDWYAVAVLAMRSLTGLHPYGGTAAGLATLPLRAAARRSVLGCGVVVPATLAVRLEALPAPLLAWFAAVFERGDRSPLPVDVVRGLQRGARRCPTCGLERAGTVGACPACVRVGAVPRQLEAGIGCEALLEAAGPILAVAATPSRVVAVVREARGLVAVSVFDGRRVALALPHAARPALVVTDGAFVVWASAEGALVVHDALTGDVVHESTTEVAFGRPAIALSDGVLHRIARGTLLAAKLGGASVEEAPLAAVVAEQTELAAAPGGVIATEIVFGVRRRSRFFGARRVELDVEPLGRGERVLDESVAAGARTTAVLTVVRANGADRVDVAVWDERGRRLGASTRPIDARAAGAAIANALVSGASVLVAGPTGLVREDLVTRRETRFSPPAPAETLPFERRDLSLPDAMVAPESILVATDAGLLVAAGHVLSRLRIRS